MGVQGGREQWEERQGVGLYAEVSCAKIQPEDLKTTLIVAK